MKLLNYVYLRQPSVIWDPRLYSSGRVNGMKQNNCFIQIKFEAEIYQSSVSHFMEIRSLLHTAITTKHQMNNEELKKAHLPSFLKTTPKIVPGVSSSSSA